MRSKNPELMKEICTYVSDYYRIKRSSPSVSEIAKGVGIAKTTAYRYLVEMNEQGMISYDGHTIETPQIDKCVTGYFSAPIVGSIHCGDPETEEEHVEEYVTLPESIFGKGEFYILRASGDSMVDAGIEDKDLVVIKKQSTASVGDIVVALDQGMNNLKVLGYNKKRERYFLRSCNQDRERYADIYPDELRIQGVAVCVSKKLGKVTID